MHVSGFIIVFFTFHFFTFSSFNVCLLWRINVLKIDIMKKALGETQTLRAGCSKAESQIFAPPQTPSRGRGTAKI